MPRKLTPDAVLGKYEKFLLYGTPGTGKTQLAFSAPDPIYAIGVGGENEFKTVYSKKFIDMHGKREIFFNSVTESRGPRGQMLDNPNGFDQVCDTIDKFLEWNEAKNIGIQTLIIDNSTVLEEYMMNKAIAAEYAMATGKSKTTLSREREYGIRRPHDTTWAGAQSLMESIVRWLFELPFHIVLVAHEYQTFTQKENSRERQLIGVAPLFVGQQRVMIANAFDNVWRTTTGGGGRNQQFNIQTIGDELVTAKTRVGGILNAVERNLSLSEVIKSFKEHASSLSEAEGAS